MSEAWGLHSPGPVIHCCAMKLPAYSVIAIVLLCLTAIAQETPDWAVQEFDGTPDQVYAAALKSILQQKHDIKSKDTTRRSADFHVGTTAWSWGYNMRLIVDETPSGKSKVTVGILRSGGKAFSWGSGKKEVRKVFAGIDAELMSAKANRQPAEENSSR